MLCCAVLCCAALCGAHQYFLPSSHVTSCQSVPAIFSAARTRGGQGQQGSIERPASLQLMSKLALCGRVAGIAD